MSSATALGTTPQFLVLVALLLVVARALGSVTERLGLTRVVGELGTGFVLGPSVFGRLLPSMYDPLAPAVASTLLSDLSLLGLVLLLTLAGLETDVELVRSYARDVITIGSVGVAVPFAFGLAFGLVIPAFLLTDTTPRLVFALFLATSLCISAIPVIVRILIDLEAFDSTFGQRTVATAMYTDVVGWLLLSVVVGVARVGRLDLRAVGVVVLTLSGFLLGAVFLGQRVVDAILARLDDADGRGHLVILVAAAVGGSALTYAAGIEPALGAFAVGLLFARAGGIPDRARATFEQMTLGVFAPLFFGVAGLNADLGLLFDPTVAVVGTATLVIATVGKIGGVSLAASWLGYDGPEAVGMGIGLNARGAIEIVVATVGLELGILSTRMYTVVIAVAVLTSAMTPPLLRRVLQGISGDSTPR
ncbi:cation:proton antiporter [Halogeometricum luteum]|uniref:Cation:proton antiporter n=1 Tax=Halogeometricum luteum TaxID=2950537 RepID=A0ABU2G3B1_9EURY|nr:cation:proton antiporter [Halogeometricum sp. S3BR5-2]MDS0295275.1 cation:proton antiporter [Halogeometricum sp. S3BR5-2]